MLSVKHPLVLSQKSLVTRSKGRVKLIEVDTSHATHVVRFDSLIRSHSVPCIILLEVVAECLKPLLLFGSIARAKSVD